MCYNLQICEQLFGWLTDAEWDGSQQLNGRIILDGSRHHKVSHQHYGVMGPNKGQHLEKQVPVANMTALSSVANTNTLPRLLAGYPTNLSVSCW